MDETRNNVFTIRFSDREKNALRKLAKHVKRTRAEVLREVVVSLADALPVGEGGDNANRQS